MGFGRKLLLGVRRRAVTGTLADPLFGMGLWAMTLRASAPRSRAHGLRGCVRTGEDGVEVALQATSVQLRSPSLTRAYRNTDATLGADTRRSTRSSPRASSHATPRGLRNGARARNSLGALGGTAKPEPHPLSRRSRAHFPLGTLSISSVLTIYLDWAHLSWSPLHSSCLVDACRQLAPTDDFPLTTTTTAGQQPLGLYPQLTTTDHQLPVL